MKLIYLAHPYSHKEYAVRISRFDSANRAAGVLMMKGYAVFSPISHTHPIAMVTPNMPTDWNYWRDYDTCMIRLCFNLIVCTADGWKESVGVQAEIKIAQENGIPVEYMVPV